MEYLKNTAIGIILSAAAFYINIIYSNGLIGFVVLMVLTFMGILILLIANHSE